MPNGDGPDREGRFRRWFQTDDPTRVVLRRVVAFAVDTCSLLLVIVLAALVTPGTVGIEGGRCPEPVPEGHACFEWEQQAYLIDGSAALLYFGVLIGAVVFLLVALRYLLGTSFGKWLLRVRVVDRAGQPPSRRQMLVRFVALALDAFPVVLPVGLWLALLTPGHRRAGDFLAQTWVVRADAVGRPLVSGDVRPPAP